MGVKFNILDEGGRVDIIFVGLRLYIMSMREPNGRMGRVGPINFFNADADFTEFCNFTFSNPQPFVSKIALPTQV